MDGLVGRPLLVDFSWVLDTSHGADYFRRWHREKQNSGGLLVHKSTHHFDLVNGGSMRIPKASLRWVISASMANRMLLPAANSTTTFVTPTNRQRKMIHSRSR